MESRLFLEIFESSLWEQISFGHRPRKDDAMANTMSPSVSAGQIGKLQDLFAARLRKSGLPSESVQKVLEERGDAVAEEMVAVIRRWVFVGNPDAFFRTRPGILVDDNFRTLVVAKTSPGAKSHTVATKRTKLAGNTTDAEIEKMLGERHTFTEDQLCDTLAEMLQEQWGGQAGRLLTGEYANIFYTNSCVVRVSWSGTFRSEWNVRVCGRGGPFGYVAGYQVFSPATE